MARQSLGSRSCSALSTQSAVRHQGACSRSTDSALATPEQSRSQNNSTHGSITGTAKAAIAAAPRNAFQFDGGCQGLFSCGVLFGGATCENAPTLNGWEGTSMSAKLRAIAKSLVFTAAELTLKWSTANAGSGPSHDTTVSLALKPRKVDSVHAPSLHTLTVLSGRLWASNQMPTDDELLESLPQACCVPSSKCPAGGIIHSLLRNCRKASWSKIRPRRRTPPAACCSGAGADASSSNWPPGIEVIVLGWGEEEDKPIVPPKVG